MRKELYVPEQEIEESLLAERAGTPFLLEFPKVIPEQPYLGQIFKLASLSLVVSHTIRLKVGQEEAFPIPVQASLRLLRNAWVVGVWELGFQMRLEPGTEGKRWTGEATVYQDLVNPVDYRSGDTLKFAVSGVIPGNIGSPPQPTAQEKREIEIVELQVKQLETSTLILESTDTSVSVQEGILAEQAEIINAIIALEAETGTISEANLTALEEIRVAIEEIE